jgi:hypothetical protein
MRVCGKGLTLPSITTHNFTLQETIMRTLRQLFAASVFTLMLVIPTFAGEMSTTLVPPSAPTQGVISTPVNGEITTGAPGDMHTGEATAEGVLAEAVVDLVQGVLALL